MRTPQMEGSCVHLAQRCSRRKEAIQVCKTQCNDLLAVTQGSDFTRAVAFW